MTAPQHSCLVRCTYLLASSAHLLASCAYLSACCTSTYLLESSTVPTFLYLPLLLNYHQNTYLFNSAYILMPGNIFHECASVNCKFDEKFTFRKQNVNRSYIYIT